MRVDMKPYQTIVTAMVLAFVITSARSQEQANMEEVVTIGSKEAVQNITGSAHYIGAETLDKFEYSDIQRISREVPGVSIQIEDGYGSTTQY